MARGKGRSGGPQPSADVSRRVGQPVRVAPGQPFGERKKITELQQAAPMEGGERGAVPSRPAVAPAPPSDIFGPTTRPGRDPLEGLEPPSSGLPFTADDPQMLLRHLYALYPHPEIARLIDG
jgi:hypothetical protein